MLKRGQRRWLVSVLIILEVTYSTTDPTNTEIDAHDAQSLQGASTGNTSSASPPCPVTADDFGPLVPGTSSNACVFSNDVNVQEFCSNCLCTIYSIAAESLGNTSIPPNHATAAELYAELFGPHQEPLYSSGLLACDPLVVSVLTAAGAFPASSWRGVDTCMSLSASRGLVDFQRYGASCSLRDNFELKGTGTRSSAGRYRTGRFLLPLILSALLTLSFGWL